MGAVLALGSALCFGIADFAGGLLSRRASAAAVALTGQVFAMVLMLAIAPLVPAADVALPALGWGVLSGIGTGAGMMFLYRGLSHGSMSVVVPLSSVGAVALPVVLGVVLLGDRPSLLAWIGIVVAVPALWFVSRIRHGAAVAASGSLDGLVASAGFALQYIALAQADPAAGLWPVAIGRIASVLTILPLTGPGLSRLPWRITLLAAGNGAVAAAAQVCYALAARYQLLAIAVVLSSLYPAIPVLLGLTALRERLNRQQVLGLVGAAAAIGLLVTG